MSQFSNHEASSMINHSVASVASTTKPKWMPPAPNYTKVNVDGATIGGHAAVVAVSRDHYGTIICCTFVLLDMSDPLLFEATAFRCGLHLGISSTTSRTIIEGDALNIIRWILDRHLHPPWQILHIIEECHFLLVCNPHLEVVFSPRTINALAHYLAKKAALYSLSGSWLFPHFPTSLRGGVVSGL